MSLEIAVRWSEMLLALAFIQQSIEHLSAPGTERWLFATRLALALLLLIGLQPSWALGAMLLLSLAILHRFDGPYNGGSDRMSLLLLICLLLSHLAPTPHWQEIALGYLSVQLLPSYTIAGWVKLANPDWRSGQALKDVFEFSVYPVSESIRAWAGSPRLLFGLSWTMMLFEILFPLGLLNATGLMAVLSLAALFHLINGGIFGLNRFLWSWIAAYPCLIWFQQRVFGG
ncbi:MAG: HTTM domain-containing protein [Deltaproteobacteria bacterium]|nr:HTTM domain-containing protein [Deltaproteobacteria bacterium]